jgi:hypothetical protein
MSTAPYPAEDFDEPPSSEVEGCELTADFVLIGPRVDNSVLAQTFAAIGLTPAALPRQPFDPHRTVEIPTTNVKLLRRQDGVVLIEVDGEVVGEAQPADGSRAAQLTLRAPRAGRFSSVAA